MIDRVRRSAGRGWPAALLLALAVALLVPAPSGLDLATSETIGVAELRATVAALPPASTVVVGFDPDLGTYAEIRPTVRAVIAELLMRDTTLAVMSLTPEGRALAVGELARLGVLGVDGRRLIDLGFVPGAEAALVAAVDGLAARDTSSGAAAERLAADGLESAALVVVVGGNDIGPRSWVEQVATRLPALPIVAVTPTVLLPELQPLVASGQLDGLAGTLRDGAAYRAGVPIDVPRAMLEARPIGPLPILLGVLVALGALAVAAGSRLAAGVRAVTRGSGG